MALKELSISKEGAFLASITATGKCLAFHSEFTDFYNSKSALLKKYNIELCLSKLNYIILAHDFDWPIQQKRGILFRAEHLQQVSRFSKPVYIS